MKLLALLTLVFTFSSHAKECLSLDFPTVNQGYSSFEVELPSKINGTGYVTLTGKKESHSANFWCMKQKDHTHCVGDDDGGSVKIYDQSIVIDYLNFGNPDGDFVEFKGSSKKYYYLRRKCN